jgi:methionyl-tRNA formyltransferase
VNLVFLGTPTAAVPAFRALIDAGHRPSLVVTQPDRPVGRSRRPVPPPVKLAALEAEIPVFQPTKVRNAAFRERLEACEPDALVVVAYGRILPASVLRLGRLGAINVHFSVLPAYRGAAPVQWALAQGENVTGVTTMQMNERMDEGDILLQETVAIGEDEHAPALETRLADTGARLLMKTLTGLERGTISPRRQDDALATLAPLLTRGDGFIDPGLTAREIAGRVRGFDPWPGVWVARGAKRVRILEAREIGEGDPEEPPGLLVGRVDDALIMACGQATRLALIRVQPAGGKALTALDALNGRHLQVGDRLEAVAQPA